MKQVFLFTLAIGIAALLLAPAQVLAAPGDTLVVYATPKALDEVITADTLVGGNQAHKVYKLVSRDTTYLFQGAITVKTDFTVLGVTDPVTGRPPCIQPAVLSDNSIPASLFVLTGKKTKATFKNLYLLGLATNSSANNGGVAIQVSADSITVTVDHSVFEEWLTFAIGYNGNYDKFFITNNNFRNMVEPNQWYIGEVLRNEWPGAAYTDSVVMKYNTMFCVNGYAAGTVTKYYETYFEFTHNSVVLMYKNPMFIFNVTNAKINNNIFYGAYAGAINKTEYPWWDQLWSPEIGSIIDLDTLDLAKDSVFNPGDKANANFRWLSEAKRNVEVKNNAWFFPASLTSWWKAWNDTAHTDSLYLPTWMNTRTTGMFSDKVHWPGLVQSGNVNLDPSYGASIPAVLTQSTNGLLAWSALCRQGTLTTQFWDYQKTHVGSAANWKPAWPVPEANDMKYTNAALKTGGTDGGPIGDPNWFGILLSARTPSEGVPQSYALSQNYPNPFNPATKIDFTIPAASQVELKVYNVLGQEVATLVNETLTPGSHTVTFDASKFSSGVYMYKITAGSFVSTRKMVLLK